MLMTHDKNIGLPQLLSRICMSMEKTVAFVGESFRTVDLNIFKRVGEILNTSVVVSFHELDIHVFKDPLKEVLHLAKFMSVADYPVF